MSSKYKPMMFTTHVNAKVSVASRYAFTKSFYKVSKRGQMQDTRKQFSNTLCSMNGEKTVLE
jgi:hypothetical protein